MAASSAVPINEASPSSAPVDGAPIAPSLLASLRHMLFGMEPNPQDVERWHQQAFRFSAAIPWGLIQTVGGPCGILAPVQAFVLHDLIFNRNAPSNDASPVVCDSATAQAALISALSTILMMCRGRSDSGATLAIGPPESPRLVFLAFDSDAGLKQRIQTVLSTPSMVAALHAEGAVLDFVYSALLTRGIERVRDDMDDSSIPLVARFGHCSQELVNLMIVGEAVTNVFDGNKTLAENMEDPTAFFLHGISHQGDVGFLTVLEALRYSKVGAYLKAPKFPVWVVGSSSHYTVLFSRDARINQVSARQQRLDQMRVHFQQLDPHEQGFIQGSELSTLLDSLKLTGQIDIYDLRKACDPDHLGIIVWDRFHQAVTKALDNPPADWNCGVCTFKNAANRNRCEMCDTLAPPKEQRPAAAKPIAADQKDVDIQAFPLYHYNGLEGTRLVPQCCAVQVTLLGQGVGLDALSSSQGLREVIQTRWPDALVDYDGPDPRIT